MLPTRSALVHTGHRVARLLGLGLHNQRPVFLHIPKTAGSSIKRALREQFPWQWAVSVTGDGDMPDVWAMPAWRFDRCAYYAGHFGMETVDRVRGEKYVFTFVRDPAERTLSLYHYLRRLPEDTPLQAARAAQHLSLLDFLRCDEMPVRHAIEDRQTRQLTETERALEARTLTAVASPKDRAALAIQRLESFAFVGLADRYDEGLCRLSHGLGLRLPSYTENVSEGRRTISELSAAERDAIERVVPADRIVYDWAMKRWE